MPNRKLMEAAAENRQRMRSRARRIHRKHGAQARELIGQLAGPTQRDHDRAYGRLREMGEFVVPELLEALEDPTTDPIVVDEVISLLALTGDERALEPVWRFFQDNQDDPERGSTAALGLASLGDDRALPHLREYLDADDEELVANSVAGMIMVGQLEDVPGLRAAHCRHRANREIRAAVASAVLAILEETDQHTFNRTLDEIRTSFADRNLWDDIWDILESSIGHRSYTLH
jgi:HEAT repeat protein